MIHINFNVADVQFVFHKIKFEWKRFASKCFPNESLTIYRKRERENMRCVEKLFLTRHVSNYFILIYTFSKGREWKIISFGDCLSIYQTVQTYSIHKKRSICNYVMDGQTVSKTHDFSSTVSWGYIDHDEWCGLSIILMDDLYVGKSFNI